LLLLLLLELLLLEQVDEENGEGTFSPKFTRKWPLNGDGSFYRLIVCWDGVVSKDQLQ